MVADPEVRVWFPSTVVEVVRLRWDCRSDIWADRETRWDERGPVVREGGLVVRHVGVYPAGIPFSGRDEARSELGHG